MSHKVPKLLARLHRHYRVDSGKGFSLKQFDPDDHRGLDLKDLSDELLAESVKVLSDLQERLYAQDRWSVLLVFQALDAAGKDGTIKHVMSGLNPQGCEVHSLQGAVGRGARPRLPVAHHRQAATARPHRHLQPFVLRGDADRAGAPGDPRQPAAAGHAGHQEDLEGALRGRLRLRALSRPAGRRHPQVLPASVEGRAAPPLPRPARRTGEELEVLARRRPRARALRRLPARLRGRHQAHRHAKVRRGTSSPPTASGSRGWWSPRR